MDAGTFGIRRLFRLLKAGKLTGEPTPDCELAVETFFASLSAGRVREDVKEFTGEGPYPDREARFYCHLGLAPKGFLGIRQARTTPPRKPPI